MSYTTYALDQDEFPSCLAPERSGGAKQLIRLSFDGGSSSARLAPMNSEPILEPSLGPTITTGPRPCGRRTSISDTSEQDPSGRYTACADEASDRECFAHGRPESRHTHSLADSQAAIFR